VKGFDDKLDGRITDHRFQLKLTKYSNVWLCKIEESKSILEAIHKQVVKEFDYKLDGRTADHQYQLKLTKIFKRTLIACHRFLDILLSSQKYPNVRL
jgi:hypothetical protein